MAKTKDGRFVGFTSHAATENPLTPPRLVSYKPFIPNDSEPQPTPNSKSEEPISVPKRFDPERNAGIASTRNVTGNHRPSERRRSKFISEYTNEEDGIDDDKIEEKRRRKKERAARKMIAQPTPIILPEYISVTNLATALRVPMEEFGAKMLELGFEDINHDHILDAETAGLVASEFNYEPTVAQADEKYDLHARPPVDRPW